jgi:hypothetical protein
MKFDVDYDEIVKMEHQKIKKEQGKVAEKNVVFRKLRSQKVFQKLKYMGPILTFISFI